MKSYKLHFWNVTPQEAKAIQNDLAGRVIRRNDFKKIEMIAGADIALDPKTNTGYAGVVVYSVQKVPGTFFKDKTTTC